MLIISKRKCCRFSVLTLNLTNNFLTINKFEVIVLSMELNLFKHRIVVHRGFEDCFEYVLVLADFSNIIELKVI